MFVFRQLAAKLGIEATREELMYASELPEKLQAWLEKLGLMKRHNKRFLLTEFLTVVLEQKGAGLSPARQKQYHTTIKQLVDYLGKDMAISELTVGDAKAFRQHLVDNGKSEATVSSRIKIMKAYYNVAVDNEFLTSSPFAKVKSGKQDKNRFVYVPVGDIEVLLENVPCPEWRAMIILWRFGGLRAQEPLHLTWDCVDWENKRLTVKDVKRRQERIIPLWPRVEIALSELFALAVEGQPRIITKYKAGQKLGTQMVRFIKHASLTIWEKPIQNLRASCQNDLELSGIRMTAICQWIGNSKAVAQNHYLKVTDSDFDNALLTSEDNLDWGTHWGTHRTEQTRIGEQQETSTSKSTAIPAGSDRFSDLEMTKRPREDSNLRPTV